MIQELTEALASVKTLRGLIPICASRTPLPSLVLG
jgi:hypothetical protein